MILDRSLLGFALMASIATQAIAQPAIIQAETLFKDGRSLMAAGRFAEACTAFETSQKLAPVVTTLLNLASCREKAGQCATAWKLFVEAEDQQRGATDEDGRKLYQSAATHAARLEPRLSKLSIDVPADHRLDRLEIRRGPDVIDESAWNRHLPMDAGTYKIAACAPGHDEWSITITVKLDGDVQTVTIPRLAVSPVALVRQPMTKSDPPASHVLSLTLAGSAMVLVGGGIGFEFAGRNQYDRARTEADASERRDLENAANTRRHIAEGLGVAAMGCAGVAIYLYVRERGNESATRASRRMLVSPMASGELAGITLNGAW